MSVTKACCVYCSLYYLPMLICNFVLCSSVSIDYIADCTGFEIQIHL